MDKNTKLAIKRMRDIQKIRAGYAKKLVVIEQNLTKIGWEIMVGEAHENDEAMGKATKAVDASIAHVQEALNALGRVEPGLKSATKVVASTESKSKSK